MLRPTCATSTSDQKAGMCKECSDIGCHSNGDGCWVRARECPLMLAGGPDNVLMCLHCDKPMHRSEPLTFIENANPGKGGCHARCVNAYHAARKTEP